MAKFNLEDYETVEIRIKKFYEKYPEGRILTDLVSDIDDIETVIFKSFIYNGEILLSTGWAFEREGDGFVNKTCHLENCETSAIGRGLANIGLSGDKRPSREEMQKVERMQGEPNLPKKPKNDKRNENLNRIKDTLGKDAAKAKGYCESLYPDAYRLDPGGCMSDHVDEIIDIYNSGEL